MQWAARARRAADRRRTAWRAQRRCGASVAFVGQVADDQLGTIFTHDMRALGVRFETPPLVDGPPTGRCLILVTADGERTMNTSPGAAHCLPPEAVDEEAVRAASILYLEGYLFGPELCRQAMFRAIDIAHAAERTVAFTLSESVCLPGRKEPLQKLIAAGRDRPHLRQRERGDPVGRRVRPSWSDRAAVFAGEDLGLHAGTRRRGRLRRRRR